MGNSPEVILGWLVVFCVVLCCCNGVLDSPGLAWYLLRTQGWSQTHRDQPASVPQVLGNHCAQFLQSSCLHIIGADCEELSLLNTHMRALASRP